jgi:hypothetical protein
LSQGRIQEHLAQYAVRGNQPKIKSRALAFKSNFVCSLGHGKPIGVAQRLSMEFVG